MGSRKKIGERGGKKGGKMEKRGAKREQKRCQMGSNIIGKTLATYEKNWGNRGAKKV